MDGKYLSYGVRLALQEGATSEYIDERTTYDYLYEAACDFVTITQSLRGEQSITTVASTAYYNLDAEYLSLYLVDDFNQFVIKYSDGSSIWWIPFRDYGSIITANNTTSVNIPQNFTIRDAPTMGSVITSTASANGTSTGGESTLTDTTQSYLTTVSKGDQVHNITDGSDGVIVSITDATHCQTALFNGTNSDWSTSDSYKIIPQGRKQLYLDPAPSTSGHTITLYYLRKPDPVYTQYRAYSFDSIYAPALIRYAAWLYKYRDSEPNFGDRWYQLWDRKVRNAKRTEDKAFNRSSWKVNFNKRSLRDRSMR